MKRSVLVREEKDGYAVHSLRAGFFTSAVKRAVPVDLVMQQTGHRSVTEMNGYIRGGKNFKDTAAAMVGL